MVVNSHDMSSQPKRAMNHALICPLRIATQVSTRFASHQTTRTISAAGTTPGTDRAALRNEPADAPCHHIAIAPLAVRPTSASAMSASAAEIISVQIVDSGVIRNAQYTPAVRALPARIQIVASASLIASPTFAELRGQPPAPRW